MTQITPRPRWLNARTNTYDAWELRKDTEEGIGVYDYESFRVMQTQAGANMSVDVGKTGVGLMKANVRGSTRDGQGIYDVDNIDTATPLSNGYVAQLAVAIGANASGNPRLDQIIIQISDSEHAGGNNSADVICLPGTANAATTLDTRTGAAALPASSILLADVLVANGAASILTASIRDRRVFPQQGTIPPLLTAKDFVGLTLPSGLRATAAGFAHASHDTSQCAYLAYIPRRIKGATKINWRYAQGGTAATGNYVIAIFDATGRAITGANTGSVAFTGAANAFVERAETITATDFEPGAYYVFFGLDSTAGGAAYWGVDFDLTAAVLAGPTCRNLALRAFGAGITVPTTLLAMTDVGGDTVAADTMGVPLITLSVG